MTPPLLTARTGHRMGGDLLRDSGPRVPVGPLSPAPPGSAPRVPQPGSHSPAPGPRGRRLVTR